MLDAAELVGGGAGRNAEGSVRCRGCKREYTQLQGVLALFVDVDAEREDWAQQLAALCMQDTTRRAQLLAQAAGSALPKQARARVDALLDGLAQHRKRIVATFAEIGVHSDAVEPKASDAAGVSPRARVPGEGNILAHYHQLLRDWSWDAAGSRENVAAFESTVSLLAAPSQRADACAPKTMLVLGAGSCRLAHDLHCAWGLEHTVALDINPLPFLLTAKVLAGETVHMLEFPLSPRTSQEVVVPRTLCCEQPCAPGFVQVFADALQPPVPDGAFDLVLTPWFIDQVPPNLEDLLPEIRRVLAPGGRWVNHGPLVYHPAHTMYGHRYREDEVLALVHAAGFEVSEHRWQRMRYLESPAGSQGRTEGVLSFVAQRRDGEFGDETTPIGAPPAAEQPHWLGQPDAAVPRFDGLADYEPPHPMFAAVVRLIDGKHTARDMAQVLVREHGLPPNAALGGVQTCLNAIYRSVAGHGTS